MTQQRVAQSAPGARRPHSTTVGRDRARPRSVRRDQPLRWDAWRCSAVLLGVLLAVTGVGLAYATRHEWFYIDEWTFIVDRTGRHPAVGILVPHNGHPSVVPALVWRGIWQLVGLRSYLPYLVPVLVLHLVDVTLVWVLSRRSGAGPWSCLAVAAIAAIGGVGAADITWAFQIGFLGSLAGALGAALLVDRAADRAAVGAPSEQLRWRRRLPLGAWVLLTLSISCSLMAVPLAVLPFGTAWARSGLRAALKLVSVPALLLGAYLAVYGHLLFGGSGQAPDPFSVSRFALAGIESVLAATTGVPGSTVVAFVVVLVALRRGVLGAGAPLATAGLATVLAEYLFVGVGRASQGPAAATAGRYAYVALIVGLPAVAVLMTRLVQPGPVGPGDPPVALPVRRVALPAALAVAVALVCWNGCQLLGAEITTRDTYGRVIRGQYLAAQEILAQGGSLAWGLDLNARTLSLKSAALVDVGARDGLDARRPGPGLQGFARVAPADVAAVRQRMQLVFAPLVRRAPTRAGDWLPDTLLTARIGDTDRLVHPRPRFAISAVHGGIRTVLPPASSPGAAAGWTGIGSCVTVAPDGAPFSVSLTPRGPASAVVVRPAGTTWAGLSWGGRVGSAAETATGALHLVGGLDYQLTMLGDLGRAVISSPVSLTVCGVTG